MFIASVATCNANAEAFRCVIMLRSSSTIIRTKYMNFGATELGNFQYLGVQIIWIIVGPIVLAVGADRDCLDFSLYYIISLFFLPSL